MGGNKSPRNRGVNRSVAFDLGEFTRRLFSALGSDVQFTGPGPTLVNWHSSTTSPDERFAIDYLASELFSKYDDGNKSPEKRRKAVERFMEGEILCSLTNCKFSPLASGQPPDWLRDLTVDELSYTGDVEPPQQHLDAAVFQLARKHISRVLGAFPGWDQVLQYADFGPGATTRLSRRFGHRSNKWAGSPHATPFLQSPLEVVFDRLPLLRSRLEGPGVEIHPGNKLDWVPKNYKTDRTIAIEPDWNMFLQKGLGGLIRRRLKRVGQDLDDQSVNRFLAAIGSIDGSLATLDLSMASDTVSYRLVEYLIRPDWFEALEQCRSSVGFYVDNGIENAVIYEKFSSMGNGYTFELESLIFWGLLRAVSELAGETDHRLYVYGDDVVVPSGLASVAMSYLEKAGFVVNEEKSFSSGPFRESCGGHYFNGTDVTPFYVREAVDSLDRLFLLHNNVYRWLNRFPGICDPEVVRGLLNWIRSHAPEKWRAPRILTEDVGDGAFIGAFDEVRPSPIGKSRRKRGWEGWRAEVLQYSARRTPVNPVEWVDSDGIPHSSEYHGGKGPDLAALWTMDRREANHPWSGSESRAFWLANLRSRDLIDAVFRGKTSEGDVPYAERYWSVGTQVLPWTPGGSWW